MRGRALALFLVLCASCDGGTSGPTLLATPRALVFNADSGGVPAAQHLTVTNDGDGTLSWSITSDQAWLTATPASGDTTNEAPATINVAASAMPDGSYAATLTITAPDADGSPATVGVILTVGEAGPSRWDDVNDFTYQLQDVDLTRLGSSTFDLVVMDYSSDGSDAGRWSAAEIAALKASPGGAKLVLSYMSIGEAEDYRWYWQGSWDADRDGTPDSGAPGWLGPSNPDWPGNYKVRYWDPAWQALIMGAPDSYLDMIIEAGFDGVYLDIIDAYEYWGPDGEGTPTRATAEQDMVAFVKAIADYARVTRGKTDFGVFPQNGSHLASHADYVLTVSGIGREDLWYTDDTPNEQAWIADGIADLDVFRQAGRLVLVIDYVRTSADIDDFYAKARGKGYVPYATVRALDQLTINPGHEPD